MDIETVVKRVDQFERTVALCVCVVPFLFSAQLVLVSLSTPVFAAMFADFGAKLPVATQVVFDRWPRFALAGCIVPLVSIGFAVKGSARVAVVLATVTGLGAFLLAQFVTIALCLPIFQLGAVSGE